MKLKHHKRPARYFEISDPEANRIAAMADGEALGRVLADLLRQYLVGAARFLVREVTEEEFEAYRNSAGSVRL
jgi:hypothetical protein